MRMRNLILFLVSGVLSIAAVMPAATERPVLAAAPVASAPPTAPRIDSDTRINADTQVDSARLVAYLVDTMNRWPRAAVPAADYDAIAQDIAAVVTGSEEGVLLAGLAYWEGARFARSVDEGLCNNWTWRRTTEGRRTMHVTGDCDGSLAHSLWQIHPIVDRSSRLYGVCNLEAVDGSRLGAARCALAIARASRDLTGYTGEPPRAHPKADVRLRFVRAALARHPFLP